jgi:hypothetical protein
VLEHPVELLPGIREAVEAVARDHRHVELFLARGLMKRMAA